MSRAARPGHRVANPITASKDQQHLPRKAEPDVDVGEARDAVAAATGPQVTGGIEEEGSATHHPVGARTFKRTAIGRRTFV